MMNFVFKEVNLGKAQADGAFTVTLSGNDYKPYLKSYVQVTVEPDTATTGSIAIEVSPYLPSTFEPVYDDLGAPLTVSLSAMETVEFAAALSDIKFTPTAVDLLYNVYVTVWQEPEATKV